MPFDLLDAKLAATFLGGAAVGAAGKYLADKFTDQRHKMEEEQSERRKFADSRPATLLRTRRQAAAVARVGRHGLVGVALARRWRAQGRQP
jgi:hypothetical protein